MQFTVYVLESFTTHRLYIGHTNNFQRRLREHVDNHVVSTKNRGPWCVLKTIHADTRAEAVKLELKLKRMKNPARVRIYLTKHY